MKQVPPQMLANAQVLVRSGRIRDIKKLVKQYGGKPHGWVHKTGPAFNVRHLIFEYHWYEHPGIEPVNIKLKRASFD